MTAKAHILWVQELLASQGMDVLVDDNGSGALTFTANGKSKPVAFTDLLTRNYADVAAEVKAALT